MTYLIQQFKAKRFASLYSPFFPYYVLSEKGNVRLLRMEFYHAEVGGRDVVLLTGDCQPTTSEGQFEVASTVLDFAKLHGANLVVTLGGFSGANEDKIVGASTSKSLLKKLERSGVEVNLSGSPIVGMTGVLLSLARFKGVDAVCLLGETRGYAPSLNPAKRLLSALVNVLDLKLDLKSMEKQIAKFNELRGKLMEIAEKELRLSKRRESLPYIS